MLVTVLVLRACRDLAAKFYLDETCLAKITQMRLNLYKKKKREFTQTTYRLVHKEGREISVAQGVGGEGGVCHRGQELRARRETALARVHGDRAVRGILPENRGRVDNGAVSSPSRHKRGHPAARQGIHVVSSLDDPDGAALVRLGRSQLTDLLSRGCH